MTTTLKRRREGLTNAFKLPSHERLRREVRDVFREQRKAILRFLATGQKSGHLAFKDDQEAGFGYGLQFHWPSWDDFRLGALSISERMIPVLSATWDWAAERFAPRVGLDPEEYRVVNPHTLKAISSAAFSFCDSTNNSTSDQLDTALNKLREELAVGIVDEGEALPALTKRVNRIFDKAEKRKAREIAQTETSRAVHQAQDYAAKASGVVSGWRWLASADACDTCLAIVARCPAVKLGQPFAVIGSNPSYREIYHPPAHPHCNCSMTEVLDTDVQPKWRATLNQPGPATEQEADRVRGGMMDEINDIQRTWDPVTHEYGPAPTPAKPARMPMQRVERQKPIPKPKPLPKKPRRPKPIEETVEVSPAVSGHPGEPIPSKPTSYPTYTGSFGESVIQAAELVPQHRLVYGDRAWIHHVWEEFLKMPGAPQLSLEKFKERLAWDTDARGRMVRADLTQAFSQADQQAAETRAMSDGHLLASWHFVRRANAQN